MKNFRGALSLLLCTSLLCGQAVPAAAVNRSAAPRGPVHVPMLAAPVTPGQANRARLEDGVSHDAVRAANPEVRGEAKKAEDVQPEAFPGVPAGPAGSTLGAGRLPGGTSPKDASALGGLIAVGLIQENQPRFFDQARAGAAAPAVAASGEDWTASPARIPLSTLKPEWQDAGAPSAAPLLQRGRGGEVHDPVQEDKVTAAEKLKHTPAVADTVRNTTEEDQGFSFGIRETYQLSGTKQSVLTQAGLTWIDPKGRVVVYDRSKRNARAYEGPMGAVESIAASQDGKYLYVLAGGHLQRWDMIADEAVVLMDQNLVSGKILELNGIKGTQGRGQGLDVRTSNGHLTWDNGSIAFVASGAEDISAEKGSAPSLREAGDGVYLEARGGSTRVWTRAAGAKVEDLGTIPVELSAAVVSGSTVFGLTKDGFIEWDLAKKRFRHYSVAGLNKAPTFRATIDVSPDGQRVLIGAGDQMFYTDLGNGARDAETEEAKVRRWSEENPMFIKDDVLHIGEFTFPVKPRFAPAKPEHWLVAGLRRWGFLGSMKAPQPERLPSVTKEQWQALNLPGNKWSLYQTLKGFTLGQNVLYIGETGGGKTWMASMISKLIGKKLYTVSFTEYTKNQDLLYSRTFGEEQAGKTGKTLETVLLWLNDPEGGVLLLDEMHKPLEGIAALNNILQSLTYHMGGKDYVGDRKTHYVVGTMNPTKPPYKGEPPSGELSSRFGTTLKVNYLAPAEEAALLKIFQPEVSVEIAKKLAQIAKELRKIYPDVLPLPISSRTLLYIAEHVVKFPNDDRVNIFNTTYNPGTIVEDPSIVEAIDKALKAHDLNAVGKKKVETTK